MIRDVRFDNVNYYKKRLLSLGLKALKWRLRRFDTLVINSYQLLAFCSSLTEAIKDMKVILLWLISLSLHGTHAISVTLRDGWSLVNDNKSE